MFPAQAQNAHSVQNFEYVNKTPTHKIKPVHHFSPRTPNFFQAQVALDIETEERQRRFPGPAGALPVLVG